MGVIFDKNGVACDYVILEVNKMCEKQLGVKARDVLGKKATELYQNLDPCWLKFSSKVAQNGEPSRFESQEGKGTKFTIELPLAK